MSYQGIGLNLNKPLDLNLKHRLLDRIQAKTIKRNGCWIWTGGKYQYGHGFMSINDWPVSIHRISYAIHIKPIPNKLSVCHKCDVPPCWNPAHLFLGTQAENIADMRRKNRGSNPPVHFGENHPIATLTDIQVKQIKLLRHKFKQRDLAKRFKCSQSTIWRIIHGITRNQVSK